MFRLRSGVDWFISTIGEIIIYPTFGQSQYNISSYQLTYTYILKLLESGISTSSIANYVSKFPNDKVIVPFFTFLVNKNLIVNRKTSSCLSAWQLELYSRQIAAFEQIEPPQDSVKMQELLAISRVCIIGCGGIGAPVAEMLAASGVGFFTLIDGDQVELSNLGRQIAYSVDDLHTNKVDALSRRLRKINPLCKIRRVPLFMDAANAAALLKDANIIVVAADSPMPDLLNWIELLCSASCLNTPYIVASNSWPTIRVGPLFLPKEGQSYSNYRKSLKYRWPQAALYEQECSNKQISKGTTVCACYATGSLVANAVINYLTRSPHMLAGQSLLLDINTLERKTPFTSGEGVTQ
ncbi:hypothetical protein HGI81_08480 [Olsenella sp. KGMB02461]|nr:hypothetical protein [Olsenella sp. KGMB02461]